MRYSNIVMSKNILVDKAGKNVLSYGNGAMLELMRNQAHLVNQADNYSFINYTENRISVRIHLRGMFIIKLYCFSKSNIWS